MDTPTPDDTGPIFERPVLDAGGIVRGYEPVDPRTPCGAEYDWEADGHPGGPQRPCAKPAGHEDGPATDFKRAEHSNGTFTWPQEATRRRPSGEPADVPQ